MLGTVVRATMAQPPWPSKLPTPPWPSKLPALPWPPESPDPPWSPDSPDPPWPPDSPDPPWLPKSPVPSWLPKSPFPPWMPPQCPCPPTTSRVPPPPLWYCYGAGRAFREGEVMSRICLSCSLTNHRAHLHLTWLITPAPHEHPHQDGYKSTHLTALRLVS